MLAFITAPANQPYGVALALMLLIAALELLGLVIGLGLSDALEGMLPDMDADADLDAGGHVEAPGLSAVLGWCRVGQVPLLILLVIFLTCFGLVGLVMQSVVQSVLGFLLPPLAGVPAAFVLTLPCFRAAGGLVARIIPRDETSAVSAATFVGRVATITLGTARKGSPAEAKLRDQFGQTHYVMVAPDLDDVSFTQGDPVILVRDHGAYFSCIASDNEALRDA